MNAEHFLEASRATGVEVVEKDGCVVWRGPAAGAVKPKGPMAGRRIGLLVAAEFSDYQAYTLAQYLSELGAAVEFIGAEDPVWKNTRPTDAGKGVQGMWGVSLDPMPVLGTVRCGYRSLDAANAADYEAIVVLGGHSADILTTEEKALRLIREAAGAGRTLGAIGEGMLPLIFAEAVGGRRCTGNHVV